MRILLTQIVLFASVSASAYTDPDAYVNDCTKSQGLSYCQERAKTLNGGESNTMKGLNDLVKLLNEPKRSYPEPKRYTDAEMKAIDEKLKAYKQREEADRDRQAGLMARLAPAIEEDAEERAFTQCSMVDAFNDAIAAAFKNKKWDEPLLILKYVQYAMQWKINHDRSVVTCSDVYPAIPERAWSFDGVLFTPLEKVISNDRPEDGRTYALDAHFYLGKAYMHGEGPKMNKWHVRASSYAWKPIKLKPEKALDHFARVLDYSKWSVRPNPKTAILELYRTDEKGRTATILRYQHSLIALAAYETMVAYRDGVGVKKDEAKARAVAHDLVQALAPLHLEDLGWFMFNPLSVPSRADADAQAYFDLVTYDSVKEFMDPELLAFARSRLDPAKPAQ